MLCNDCEMVSQSFKAISRWMVLMLIGGLTLGLAGLAVSEWASLFIGQGSGPENDAATEYAPIILTLTVLITAPAVASIIGVLSDADTSNRLAYLETAVGALTGSVLYVVVGLLLIGQFSSYVAGAPAFSDVAAIAGLVALTAIVAAVAAVTLSDSGPANEESTDETTTAVPSDPGPEYTA